MGKCPNCNGDLRLKSIYHRVDKTISRKRVCKSCDYTIKTIEVPRYKYDANNHLVSKLKEFLNEYLIIKERE